MPEPLDALVGIYADPPRERAALVPRGQVAPPSRRTSARRAGARSTLQRREPTDGGDHLSRGDPRSAVRGDGARRRTSSASARTSARTAARSRSPKGLIGEVRRVARRSTRPISEIGIVGAAAGAAHMGMRPVVEMQFIDFIANAYDMLTNYVATARYRAFLPCPMVVRGPSGGYVRGGPFHSQNPEAGFIHTPGLKVVYPSTAADAKGLMKAAIRDDDCVLFFEHKYLYRRIKGEMPGGRSRRADRQGARRRARARISRSSPTPRPCTRRSRPRSSCEREDGLSRRGDRPALARAARRRGDRRDGEEDQSRAHRARGHAHGRHRRRDHGAHQRDAASSGSMRRCCA